MKNQVREFRRRHGWTQAELGQRVGVSRQTILAIEAQDYVPSALLLLKLTATLNCKTEELFQLEAKDWQAAT